IPVGTDFADAMLEGSGSGTGAHFGVLVRLSNRLSLGARYLTEVTIDYDGEVSFSQWPTGIVLAAGNPFGVPRNTPLDAVLRSSFNTTLATQGATASIVMPSQVVVGVALKLRENLMLLGDYQRVGWDAFAELPLDFAELGPDTLYEDYEATSGWRAGFEYVRSPRVTVRGGMLYHGAAAPAQTVTPLLPEGARIEGTLGLGLKVSRIARLDLAYQYIRQQDRRGRVTEAPARGPEGAAANSGLYISTAKLFGASLAFAF
ncbi:MAG: outer membrane protein transport protein, partial [Gemmatimonadetes bacterium]|nr:outer membrane protein transport protein [Gemmatimonadota bacterium]